MTSEHDCQLLRRNGIKVEVARTPDAIRAAQELRHRVFYRERNIFASEPGQMIDHDDFDSRAKHVILRRSDDGEVLATARIVPGSSERRADCLPMQRYCCPSLFRGVAMDTIGEISRFAISKQSRQDASASGPLLRLGLLRGILQASHESGLTHWCALMEPSLLRLLRATGVHFTPLGPPVEAYGWRQPSIASIDLTLARGKRQQPGFYDVVAGDRVEQPTSPETRTTRLQYG
jgi:N-acyl-L-homoserine lactone synthetase